MKARSALRYWYSQYKISGTKHEKVRSLIGLPDEYYRRQPRKTMAPREILEITQHIFRAMSNESMQRVGPLWGVSESDPHAIRLELASRVKYIDSLDQLEAQLSALERYARSSTQNVNTADSGPAGSGVQPLRPISSSTTSPKGKFSQDSPNTLAPNLPTAPTNSDVSKSEEPSRFWNLGEKVVGIVTILGILVLIVMFLRSCILEYEPRKSCAELYAVYYEDGWIDYTDEYLDCMEERYGHYPDAYGR